MLEKKYIKFEDVSFPFSYGINCYDNIIDELHLIDSDLFIIITDQTVANLYGKKLKETLVIKKPVLLLSFLPGEQYKTLETLSHFTEEILAMGASRKSVIIALGGGIPGNIGGLIAALLFRGIKLVHIPTSLIAIFDSILSLKQAINSSKAKNLIGTFYLPYAVYSDLNFLKTLPENQIRSGLCETIKNVLAISPFDMQPLKYSLKDALQTNSEALKVIADISIDSKIKVMKNDKFEKKRALILEYGHTLGHAIELELAKTPSLGKITHGEAVGIGMIAAARISQKLGHLNNTNVKAHYELLEMIDAPTTLPQGISIEDLINTMSFDNKRGYLNIPKDQIGFILLKDIGIPIGKLEMPLTSVPIKVVEAVLKNMR